MTTPKSLLPSKKLSEIPICCFVVSFFATVITYLSLF
jgi:hypothetical protein